MTKDVLGTTDFLRQGRISEMPLSFDERQHLHKCLADYLNQLHSGFGPFPARFQIATRFDSLLVLRAIRIALQGSP